VKKVKYYYNTSSLRYEKLETPLRVKLLRIFGFIAAAIVTAVIIAFIAFRFIGSPKEKLLAQQNAALKDDLEDIEKDVQSLVNQMKELENRDNKVYRAIFEANPIPDSARAKEIETEKEIAKVEKIRDFQLAAEIKKTLIILKARIASQKNLMKQ
jgi:uncharacterized protein YlxW (UPF0749 family)